MVTIKGKALFAAALAAVVCSLALAPKAAHAHGAMVMMNQTFSPGTIVVRTNERRLYYVLGGGQAIAYPVGVGRAGKQWSGESYIRRHVHPPGMVAACGRAARPPQVAGHRSQRLAA